MKICKTIEPEVGDKFYVNGHLVICIENPNSDDIEKDQCDGCIFRLDTDECRLGIHSEVWFRCDKDNRDDKQDVWFIWSVEDEHPRFDIKEIA